ncbi:MAG: transglycosylase SLT domain-containing protein [Desulfonauticus sp.]|nr:transglycosylase SLT domain-containing protein [Desulfonauticus sp.]
MKRFISFWAVLLGLSLNFSLAGTIYYYCDKNGVFHFTDLPDSHLYRPFRIFKDHRWDLGKLNKLIKIYSRKYDLDPALVKAVIKVESNFEVEAVSPAGAKGLMQIMPTTQKDLNLETPFDPEANIEAGIKYLRLLLDKFHSLPLALAAYNAGPANVQKYGGIPPFQETKRYVQKVLVTYQELKK